MEGEMFACQHPLSDVHSLLQQSGFRRLAARLVPDGGAEPGLQCDIRGLPEELSRFGVDGLAGLDLADHLLEGVPDDLVGEHDLNVGPRSP